MPESLSDRYFSLIDQIVELTLKGKISSFERVYKMLLESVETGTGEIFERCLAQRVETTTAQLETKLKAARILRALQTIEKQWLRWQSENQVEAEINETARDILEADPDDYFLATVDAIDPNQSQPLTIEELTKLAQSLKEAADKQENAEIAQEWQAVSNRHYRRL